MNYSEFETLIPEITSIEEYEEIWDRLYIETDCIIEYENGFKYYLVMSK